MSGTEKEYTNLIKQIKSLRSIRASDKFREKVMAEIMTSLPANTEFHKFNLIDKLREINGKSKEQSTGSRFLYFPAFSWQLAIAGILLVFLGGTGIVFAAERSNPKDLLYPVKILVENVQLRFTQNPSVKTFLHLDNADKRIEELRKTMKKDGNGEIGNITSDYESQVKDAVHEIKNVENGKKEITRQTDEHLKDQTQQLEELKTAAPTTAVPAIENAIKTSKNEQNELKTSSSDDKNEKLKTPSSPLNQD